MVITIIIIIIIITVAQQTAVTPSHGKNINLYANDYAITRATRFIRASTSK